MSTEATIQSVADTALMVAAFRAHETNRSDALIRDPLAGKLVGDRGFEIAKQMRCAEMTAWMVIMRTTIIDSYIEKILKTGIDTVINLGAGLDTRPYRMKLPENLKWYEVDLPQIIDMKNSKLGEDKPSCNLNRLTIDLSIPKARHDFFTKISNESEKVLLITEGLLSYLEPSQVDLLAKEVLSFNKIQFWIADYFAPSVFQFLKGKKRKEQMKKAPLLFLPDDWFGFFAERGWVPDEFRNYTDASHKFNRPIPIPLMQSILGIFSAGAPERFWKNSGYALLCRTSKK